MKQITLFFTVLCCIVTLHAQTCNPSTQIFAGTTDQVYSNSYTADFEGSTSLWTQIRKSGIEATHSNDLGSDGTTAGGALKIVVTVPQSGQAGHTKLEYKSSVFCSTFDADTSVFNTLNLNYPHKITFDVKADVAGEFKVQLISSDAGTEPAAKQSLLRTATTSWTTNQ